MATRPTSAEGDQLDDGHEPMTTMTPRSAAGGRRRPTRGAEHATEREPMAMSSTTRQSIWSRATRMNTTAATRSR